MSRTSNTSRNPSRVTRVRRRKIRIRSIVSGRLKGGGPPIGSISLGSGSGLVISEEGYVATNFNAMERSYDMTLGLEERGKKIV